MRTIVGAARAAVLCLLALGGPPVLGALGDIATIVGGSAESAAVLRSPNGSAFDSSGNYYFAEATGHRIRKATPAGVVTTVAGTGSPGYGGDGGPATAALLDTPRGVAIDGSGNLHFADANNHRVRRIAPDGTITTVAGNGVAGYSGDGGAATSAPLNRPYAVAIDGTGALLIADYANHRVRRVAGGVISTVAGTGISGSTGDGGPAAAAQVSEPRWLAVDASGAIHVLENTGKPRVRKIALDGTISTVVGNGTGGFDAGDGGPATSAVLFIPQSIAFDPAGRLLIGLYSRIRRVDAAGVITTIVGVNNFFGAYGGDGGNATLAAVNNVTGIAFDAAGRMFLADTDNHRIRRVNEAGIIETVAGGFGGGVGCPANGTVALTATVNPPGATAFDALGRLHVSDPAARCIYRVESDGRTTRVAGPGTANVTPGSSVPALDAALSAPRGLAFDAAGNLFVSDSFRIVKIDAAGTMSWAAGSASPGFGGDGGPASSAKLNAVSGLAFDALGNLFVADTGNFRVRRIAPNGIISTIAGGEQAVSGDWPLAVGPVIQPVGVRADAEGSVYIADARGAGRVLKADTAGALHRIAGPAFSQSAPAALGDGGPAVLARLQVPQDVALDSQGSLYIADRDQERIRIVDAAGIIDTIAGTGTPGFGADGPALSTPLNGPVALTLGPGNTLYVAELGRLTTPNEGRVRRIELRDRVPDPFAFPGQDAVAPSTPMQSALVTPAGFDTAAAISVENGEYSVGCSGTFTTAAGTLQPGQGVCVRHTSAAIANATVTTTLVVGTRRGTFASTTAPGSGSFSVTPGSVAFGGQSMNSTGAAADVVVANTGAVALTVNDVRSGAEFPVSHDCTTLAPGASCTVRVAFRPASQGVRTGTLTVQASAGTTTAVLEGTGERSFVRHYYLAILGRVPDEPGRLFWEQEAARVTSLGMNVNETWFAMAATFFFSTEYAAFARSNDAFVADLYRTFFDRAPDAGGLAHWSGQLAGGIPREVLLAAFMFSTEFAITSGRTFGMAAVRAEIDMVTDFYRGLLSRLPDTPGFDFWVQRFRAAQCQSLPSAAVQQAAVDIATEFIHGTEYVGRARTNAQFVGDLYNAFLRRGGDPAGVQFWIGRLASNAMTRDQLLAEFARSTEFRARAANVAAQGCMP